VEVPGDHRVEGGVLAHGFGHRAGDETGGTGTTPIPSLCGLRAAACADSSLATVSVAILGPWRAALRTWWSVRVVPRSWDGKDGVRSLCWSRWRTARVRRGCIDYWHREVLQR